MAATAPSHSLFPLPMETAENSPARLPQSVHWKASNNFAYLQVQQMAATAPPHSLHVAHGFSTLCTGKSEKKKKKTV